MTARALPATDDPCNCDQALEASEIVGELQAARARVVKAIRAALEKGARIEFDSRHGDGSISAVVYYRGTQIASTDDDPIDALERAIATWGRVHG